METGIGLNRLACLGAITTVWRFVIEIPLEYCFGVDCFRVEWIGFGEFDLRTCFERLYDDEGIM
jgi:hypothetical protein